MTENEQRQAIVDNTAHTTRLHMMVLTEELTRPSVIFRPRLAKIFGHWEATYGEGPDAFYAQGASPDEAMRNFDLAWTKRL